MSNENTNNRPVDKVRVGSVNASIWRNGSFYTASFERRYKDKDGNWKSTQSYGPTDLLELSKAADLAHTCFIELMQDKAEDDAA